MKFLLVYIREAHPDDGWTMAVNEQEGIHVVDPTTYQQRQAVAETACSELHLDFPAVVDGLDNRVGTTYAGWPDRIYVINSNGTIGYKSDPGPWGFDPDALAGYLKNTVGAPGAADKSVPAAAAVPSLPAVGQPSPELQATGIDDKPISLAALRGKTILIDFWATWCPPCRAAIPDLKQLYGTFHPKGLEIVGVSLDGASTGTDITAVKDFVRHSSLHWPQICDGKGWDSPIAAQFGVTSLPTTVLVGKDGRVIASGLSGAALESAIRASVG